MEQTILMCTPNGHEVLVKPQDVAACQKQGWEYVIATNLKSDKPSGQGGSVEQIKKEE